MGRTTVAEVRRTLCAFIREELVENGGSLELGEDTPLLSGGVIDSFRFVQITAFVEERFGVYLSDGDLMVDRVDTVGQIAQLVVEKQSHV